MTEVLFRQRNKEYLTHVTLLSGLEVVAQELTRYLAPADDTPEQRKARHDHLRTRFERLMRLVEDEVFEESYLPERIREEERRARAEKIEAAHAKERDAALHAKVLNYSRSG